MEKQTAVSWLIKKLYEYEQQSGNSLTFAQMKPLLEQAKEMEKQQIIDGYTKCQQDMAVKKYTEEDIRKAITFGQGMELWKEENQIKDYINSLNKQD